MEPAPHVDLVVGMNQDITKAGHTPPRDLKMLLSKLPAEAFSCLAPFGGIAPSGTAAIAAVPAQRWPWQPQRAPKPWEPARPIEQTGNGAGWSNSPSNGKPTATACSGPWPAVTPQRHWTADSSSAWWSHRDHPAFFCVGFQCPRHQEWESANALGGHCEANPMDMGGCSVARRVQPGLLWLCSPWCWPPLPSFCSIRPIQGIPSRCAGSCASSEVRHIEQQSFLT